MDCEKCGAEVPEAADTCPECGEPMAAAETGAGTAGEQAADDPTSNEAIFDNDAAVVPADDAELGSESTVEAVTGDEGEKPGALNKTAALVALAVVLMLVVLGGVAFFVPFGGTTLVQRMSGGSDPGAAAAKMLAAYAKYDAKGILETTNAGSLPADSVKEFEKQAAEAKTRANGKDGVKNIKVVKVTIDSQDKTKAKVEISADWLEDPAKGTYTTRTEELPLIQQNGKWVVQLF